MVRGLYTLILAFTISWANGQECFNYHSKSCKPTESKYGYQVNGSSVSYKFNPGETRYIPFTLMANKDYRITLCSHQYNNVVSFKIVRADNKVIYDNAQFNYSFNMEFSSMKTQEVQLEILAPKTNVVITDSADITAGCIGILIEEMVSIKTGF